MMHLIATVLVIYYFTEVFLSTGIAWFTTDVIKWAFHIDMTSLHSFIPHFATIIENFKVVKFWTDVIGDYVQKNFWWGSRVL